MNDQSQQDAPKAASYYYLIGGVILFTQLDEKGEPAGVSSAPANAIVRHNDPTFPVHKLAKAQQNLHKSFMTKVPEEARSAFAISDIVITNVSNLGLMSEEEFQFQPAPLGDPVATTTGGAAAPAEIPEVI